MSGHGLLYIPCLLDVVKQWRGKSCSPDLFLSIRLNSFNRNGAVFGGRNTMAEQNVPAQPPTRTDEQIKSQQLRSKETKKEAKERKVSSVKLGRNKEEVCRVTPDLERKSDGTEEINIEEKKASDVKSGDTEELDLEAVQSTARQSTITPRTLNFNDEAANLVRIQSQPQPQQPSQATDPKDKGKGILVEEPKKEEISSKNKSEPWRLQIMRRLLERFKLNRMQKRKKKNLLTDSFKDFIPMTRDEKKSRCEGKKEMKRDSLGKRKAQFLKNNHQRRSKLQVIDSPDGEYLIIHRANNHFRAFDTLWEILHILDRQDLYHLYRVVQDYYEHIPPTGLGLILLGVHTLELEDGTMIHMLAERRYPLSRELMIRMLEHGWEVEDESEIAIALIHLFILWTTKDGDDS
ncbi:hypothetical protein Tco_0704403 [Tanacetum coccineum]|uniref:Uncharacterized protein n=1 Tax=Tanacetum coccineum TaxID=301880 RepID=A0ABQ4Y3I0_9ASTR